MEYYLSIVATTRNDNHGDDLIERTTAFVTGIYEQADRYKLPVELIIVEWNPPVGKQLLKEVLPQPIEGSMVCLKYIVVPKEEHDKYNNAKVIPLYQMIAKNVGIRRAKGQFILCTNIDILFSEECFKIFAEKKLEHGVYYRTNRCDVPKQIMEFPTLSERLEFGKKNTLKRLGKTQGHEILNLPKFMYIFPTMVSLANKFVLWLWQVTHPNGFAHFVVDFEACGDFTMMSRKDWADIEGYVELDMYSIHIDSMGLWAANALGKKQIIFPYNAPIYHIYHEDGWESTDALRTIRFLENKPSLDYSIVYKAGIQIIQQKQAWKFNKPTWGMADKSLPEYIFNSLS
jgi:hypothetical protein